VKRGGSFRGDPTQWSLAVRDTCDPFGPPQVERILPDCPEYAVVDLVSLAGVIPRGRQFFA